ncbi:MAG: hypothetical protein V5A62_10975 [Haloarculaceae archaeon]
MGESVSDYRSGVCNIGSAQRRRRYALQLTLLGVFGGVAGAIIVYATAAVLG